MLTALQPRPITTAREPEFRKMIRPLRRRHLIFSFLMVTGLPLMVIIGYLKTKDSVSMEAPPILDDSVRESFPLEVWHKSRLWKNYPGMDTRLLSNVAPEHELAVELTFDGTITRPDLLLYWSPRSFSTRLGIHDGMHLLGAYTNSQTTIFKLPDVARHRDGFLLLYSLAEDEMVSEAPLLNPLK